MKITIENHRLDTDTATTWDLSCYDDRSNQLSGELHCSPGGIWYVYTPSQWANGHSWEIVTPEEALAQYDDFLTSDQKEEIAAKAGLMWD